MARKKNLVPRRAKQRADLLGIGNRVRQLRGAERQEDFAPSIGISQSQLSRIERGELAPSIEVLLDLRRRFKTSIDWILTEEK